MYVYVYNNVSASAIPRTVRHRSVPQSAVPEQGSRIVQVVTVLDLERVSWQGSVDDQLDRSIRRLRSVLWPVDFARRVAVHLVGIAGNDKGEQVLLKGKGERCVDAWIAVVEVVLGVHGVGRGWNLHVSLPRLVLQCVGQGQVLGGVVERLLHVCETETGAGVVGCGIEVQNLLDSVG